MVRLIDIARAANVSRAVVSAVLSTRTGGTIRVAPATVKKIRRIASKLNYVPNVSARILNGKSSGSIGVLLDSCAPGVSVRMLRAIEHEASEHNFRTLVAESHDSAENLYENYMILCQYGVDGVICLSHDYPGQNDKVNELFAGAEKIVFVRGPAVPGQPLVKLDIAGGMNRAVEHLYSVGKEKLMLVVQNTGSWGFRSRMTGFQQAAAGGQGVICSLPPSGQEPLPEEIDTICRKIETEKIDGVIARNDFDALALISALQKRQIRVPEDVAVIGNDNEPFGKFSPVTLTTIDYNLPEIARFALAMLQKTDDPVQELTVSPELIIRNSTTGGNCQ